jgi:alanine racemase
MFETSKILLSKSAYKSNLNFIKNILGDNTILSAVVKGNAYGHGAEQIVSLGLDENIKHFSVFSAQEAYNIHHLMDEGDLLMIMGYTHDYDAMEWVIQNHIHFFVFDTGQLEMALSISKKLGKKANIHLELESGMYRTGLDGKELKKTVKKLIQHSELNIVGVCTHYAGAESVANYVRVKGQIRNFKRLCKWLEHKNLNYLLRHSACSAAALSYPETRMDLARIGILQYGYWPSRESMVSYFTKTKIFQDPLKPVMKWVSKIMSLKKVQPGNYIGYGSSYLAESEVLVAAIPVGYSSGYKRSLSNKSRVIIRDQRIGIIGLVNMNMILADVTNVSDVAIGDEVILIGKSENESISVASFGELSEQLNYELLTRLPSSIPRIVID